MGFGMYMIRCRISEGAALNVAPPSRSGDTGKLEFDKGWLEGAALPALLCCFLMLVTLLLSVLRSTECDSVGPRSEKRIPDTATLRRQLAEGEVTGEW